MSFPKDFRWGAATSSYQIEGAAHQDGRGPSIWDTFAKTPGKVFAGHDGDVACDHYNRLDEDIALMKSLGLQTYRFSMAWPRLFPTGSGQPEKRGFAFYDRLIDGLLEAGIDPMLTLYHWDLPQALQDKGGWVNRDITKYFTDYALAATDAFGDRVQQWLTINEPWCVTWLGHLAGVMAPGHKSLNDAVAVAHHTALAHAEATRAMRAENSSLKIGSALNMTNFRVAEGSDAHVYEAADLCDAQLNRWWLDAMHTGQYPEILVDYYGDSLKRVFLPGDSDLLKVDTDFLGINYYNDNFLANARVQDAPLDQGSPYPFRHRVNSSAPEPHTDMGWPITPDGLTDLLLRVTQEWPEVKELSITENGVAYDYPVNQDSEVQDDLRVEYLINHIEAVRKAVEAGAPVTSYYAWSLLDNFEWAEGYAKRFGIVHVDFQSLKRTPKASARTYADVIASHGESLIELAEARLAAAS
jgi:beta-glucosidase